MRRAVALLAPALARRSAASSVAALAQPLVPGALSCSCDSRRAALTPLQHAGGWLRFCAAAKRDSTAQSNGVMAHGSCTFVRLLTFRSRRRGLVQQPAAEREGAE